VTDTAGGTVILDSHGLSLHLTHDRQVKVLLAEALDRSMEIVVSGASLAEVAHCRVSRGRWDFALSQLLIEPMRADRFRAAAELLRQSGLSAHKYAIDAMVAVTALEQRTPVVMLTSDVDDMAKLCGDHVTLMQV
jgi:predicted nucleic acid-binding protein